MSENNSDHFQKLFGKVGEEDRSLFIEDFDEAINMEGATPEKQHGVSLFKGDILGHLITMLDYRGTYYEIQKDDTVLERFARGDRELKQEIKNAFNAAYGNLKIIAETVLIDGEKTELLNKFNTRVDEIVGGKEGSFKDAAESLKSVVRQEVDTLEDFQYLKNNYSYIASDNILVGVDTSKVAKLVQAFDVVNQISK